jgi:hypothetical protein
MPNIPLFERNVAETPLVSGRAAAAPFQALAQAGAVAADVAFDYAARRQELKEKADISDYEVGTKDFQTRLEQEKNDALQRGVHYSDIYDEIVAPALERRRDELGERSGEIQRRWALDSSSIAQREVLEREKLELADYVTKRQKEGDSLLADGDFEGADEIYDDLEGVVGLDRVNQMKSLGRYNFHTIEMQRAEEHRIDGLISDNDYFSRLESIRSQVKESDMELNHKRSLEISVNAKINNFKGKRVSSYNKAVSGFIDKVADDNVEMSDFIQLRQDAGDDMADAFEKSLEPLLRAKAVSDEDASDAIDALVGLSSGERSLPNVLKDLEETGGSIGTMGIVTAAQYVKGLSVGDKINAYELAFGKNVTMEIKGNAPDFFSTVGEYMTQMTEGQADFADDAFQKFHEWQKQNPDPTPEDYDAFKTVYFKLPAKQLIERMNAPQATGQIVGGFVVGKEYADAAGNRAVWDGEKWNEVE